MDIIDAGTVYTNKILNVANPNPVPTTKVVATQMKQAAITDVESGHYGEQQMELDTAMWYGALQSSGSSDVLTVLTNVWQTLYYGQMVCKSRSGTWITWPSLKWPISMALSHGGRVMVQLPKAATGQEDKFWNWLWGSTAKRPRKAATHGIDRGANPNLTLTAGKILRMTETGGLLAGFKSSSGGSHWGLEIPLGGAGNKNPLSGKTVGCDGASGHLYLYYLPPSADKFGGVLIGCEGSSPLDRKRSYTDKFDVKHKYVVSSDGYGGSHGFGAKNTFSGTGGLKFDGAKLKDATGNKIKVQWQDKIDGHSPIVIDLIPVGLDAIIGQPGFEREWLGRTGL